MTEKQLQYVLSHKENLAFADYVDNYSISCILNKMFINFEIIGGDLIILDKIDYTTIKEIMKQVKR